MAFEGQLLTYSRKAGADLSALQYTFVKLDANGNVIGCGVTGEDSIGVLQNKPKLGAPAVVGYAGVSKIVASAALAAGARVATDATGKAKAAVPLVQASGNGSYSMGKLLDAASGAGSIVPMAIQVAGVLPTAAA